MPKTSLNRAKLNARSFLTKVSNGQTTENYAKGKVIFHQGDAADSVFFIKKGKVKMTVVSEQGKEAIVAFMSSDFVQSSAVGRALRPAFLALAVGAKLRVIVIALDNRRQSP